MCMRFLFSILLLLFISAAPAQAASIKKSAPKVKAEKTEQIKQLKKPVTKPKMKSTSPAKEPVIQPAKSQPAKKDSTAAKAKDLLKKLNAIKTIEPVKLTPLKPIQKQAQPGFKTIFDQPTSDAPVRDYYNERPGSIGPPLLKYDLPTGL